MRKLFPALLLFTAVIIYGCFDNREEVNINSDGSGVYHSVMDMSGMIPMLEMAVMMDTTSSSEKLKQMMSEKIDSNINLDHYADTASFLTDQERQLLRGGSIRMLMNVPEQQFRVEFRYSFRQMDDLELILAMQKEGKIPNPFGSDEKKSPMKQMSDASSFMEMNYERGLIERSINTDEHNEFKENPEMKDVEQLKEMFSEVKFTTVYNLPAPVKKSEGSKLVFSEDKKKVTVSFTMMDMMMNPEDLAFRIEY